MLTLFSSQYCNMFFRRLLWMVKLIWRQGSYLLLVWEWILNCCTKLRQYIFFSLSVDSWYPPRLTHDNLFPPPPSFFCYDQGVIECPGPDKDIRRFDGNLRLLPPFIDNDVCPLTIKNTILQSCYLRNTEWACGVAVYTGKFLFNWNVKVITKLFYWFIIYELFKMLIFYHYYFKIYF